MLELCEKNIIDKTRYEVEFDGKTFEVDVFHGVNEGLVLAELELQTEDEPYSAPEWLGEVTGDMRYYNSYLSKYPSANGKIRPEIVVFFRNFSHIFITLPFRKKVYPMIFR